MEKSSAKQNMKYGKTIITVVSLLLMFGTKYLPPFSGLNEVGMQVAGIFFGTVVLWLFVSTTWPSILSIVALMLTPLYTYQQVLSSSMGGWITSFVLFSSMVTYALGQTGFLKRAAIYFITRPIIKKNPWIFFCLLFLAPLVIGSFMSPIPAFMVFIPIAEQIFKELDYKKGDRLPQMVILSLLCFASLSTMTTPIAHTVPILGMSLYEKDLGKAIEFVPYTIFGVVSSLVIFVLIMLLLKFVYKPDLSRMKNLDTSVLTKDLAPMSKQEKYTLIVFLGVVALWLLPGITTNIFPRFSEFFTKLGTPTPAMIGVVILCLIKIDGKPLMNFGEAISKGVPWGAVIMVASTMILGSALTNKDAGLTDYMVSIIGPAINGLSPMTFVFIVSLWVLMMTNFASNTVTVTVVYSVAMPLVLSNAISGVNPAALTSIIGAGASIAMATPPSTAHAAIAVGTGWLNTDTMLKYGMMMSLISAFVLAFIGYPVAALLM
jgi:sodium-dependent dicarboxylate transporter 2/3/5